MTRPQRIAESGKGFFKSSKEDFRVEARPTRAKSQTLSRPATPEEVGPQYKYIIVFVNDAYEYPSPIVTPYIDEADGPYAGVYDPGTTQWAIDVARFNTLYAQLEGVYITVVQIETGYTSGNRIYPFGESIPTGIHYEYIPTFDTENFWTLKTSQFFEISNPDFPNQIGFFDEYYRDVKNVYYLVDTSGSHYTDYVENAVENTTYVPKPTTPPSPGPQNTLQLGTGWDDWKEHLESVGKNVFRSDDLGLYGAPTNPPFTFAGEDWLNQLNNLLELFV